MIVIPDTLVNRCIVTTDLDYLLLSMGLMEFHRDV